MATIHSTALVDPAAQLHDSVTVGPYTIIGPNVRIGAGPTVGPHCVIEGHTTIGQDNRIFQFKSLGAIPQEEKILQSDCVCKYSKILIPNIGSSVLITFQTEPQIQLF